MPNRTVKLTCVVMLILGITGPAVAQDNGAQQPSAREQLQHVHTRNRSTRSWPTLRKIWS
jgi:hypothetical protein